MAKDKKKIGKAKTRNEIAKRYPHSGLASNILISTEDSLWLPSRILALNHQFGGGILYGKILELFGEESSGKSLIALDFAYVTQALEGVVIWADSEFAMSAVWAKQNGLDLDKLEIYPESSIEKISDWVADMTMYYRSILVKNEPILVVVDSLAALECNENLNASQQDLKAEMGNRAKAIGIFWRNRNPLLSALGVCTICINQLRSKIGASKFEDPDTTPGGKATKFYASIRVGVYGGKQITKKISGIEEKVGRLVSIRIKKNKVAPPRATLKGMEAYFNPDYCTPGFGKYVNLPDVLIKTKTLHKKGNSFYMGDERIAKGADDLMRVLKKDAATRKRLLEKSGINTISKTRVKLAELSENLFPVREVKQSKSEENNADE